MISLKLRHRIKQSHLKLYQHSPRIFEVIFPKYRLKFLLKCLASNSELSNPQLELSGSSHLQNRPLLTLWPHLTLLHVSVSENLCGANMQKQSLSINQINDNKVYWMIATTKSDALLENVTITLLVLWSLFSNSTQEMLHLRFSSVDFSQQTQK